MSLTGIINTHTMCATLVMYHGSDEQKQRLLPSMATGERRGALSLSEPDAGSDTKNLSCKAVRDGDEYVLHGRSAAHTSELQSLMRISYAGFCMKKNKEEHNKRKKEK